MDQDISLEDLCGVLGGSFPRLDCVFDKHHLLEVAKKLTQWRTLAPWLDFDAATVEGLDYYHSDEEGTRQQMLLLWKQAKGCGATYRALAEVLLRAERRELAERVLECSRKVVLCATNSLQASNASSRHSSRYHTPLQSPHPRSVYTTPPYSGTTTPLRTFQPGHSEPLQSLLQHSQQPFAGGQDGTLQVPEQQLPSGVPMQTTNDQSVESGILCMSTPVPHYPPGMFQRFNSVCGKATLCGIVPQTQTEIVDLQHRVQRLEQNLQIANQRHERELQYMNAEQQYERSEYEGQLNLLQRHLNESQLNAKFWESAVAELTRKLQQREAHHSTNHKGVDDTDFPFEASLTSTSTTSTSSSVVSRADSGEHHNYTVRSYVYEHREEITRSVVCLQRCPTCEDSEKNHEEPEDERNRHSECQQCTIVSKFTQLQGLMEEKHSEMERGFKERVSAELAAHHLKFLEVNSRLTDIVSQSLECLSAHHMDSAAEADEVKGDLHWLQEELEHCRLGRYASCP